MIHHLHRQQEPSPRSTILPTISKHLCLGFLILWVVALSGCSASSLLLATEPLDALSRDSTAPAKGNISFVTPLRASEDPAPLCRFGLNVSTFPSNPFYIDDFDVVPLRVGWYIDYRTSPSPPANNGAEYVMVMNVFDNPAGGYGYTPREAALDETIAAHPGGIYIVGNEPDRRELQDDVLPENYAAIYHEAYTEIKRKDPTAQVWAGGIVQPTPVRLQYLDRVLAAYQARYHTPMPVDGWAIHAFLLNERSCEAHHHDLNVCWGAEIPPGIDAADGEILTPQDNARLDLFKAGIVRFRTWMAANGYRNSPLYVTEYGVLMPPIFGFPPSKVNEYMRDTFDYMLDTTDDQLGYPPDGNRLVQRFAWFSTFAPEFNGDLYQSLDANDPMNPPFVLTGMGEHFRDYVAQEEEVSDLAVLSVDVAESPHQVVAVVANSGNRQRTTEATVRFYEGENLANARQIGGDVTIEVAGCGATQRVAVPWEGTSDDPATYQIWAEISQPNFPDANPDNNVVSRHSFINGEPIFLPTLKRSFP